MATAADYRKWAEEYFEWARKARDESVRQQYTNLGKVGLSRAYTQGALFYPKVEIARSNVSRAAGSRLPRLEFHRQ